MTPRRIFPIARPRGLRGPARCSSAKASTSTCSWARSCTPRWPSGGTSWAATPATSRSARSGSSASARMSRAARRRLRDPGVRERPVRRADRRGHRGRPRLGLAPGARHDVRHRHPHVQLRRPAARAQHARHHGRQLRPLPATAQAARQPRDHSLLLLDAAAHGRRDPRVARHPALQVRPRPDRHPRGGGQGRRLRCQHVVLQDPRLRHQRVVRRGGGRAPRPVPQLRRPRPRVRADHHAQRRHHVPGRRPRDGLGRRARRVHHPAAVGLPDLPHADGGRGPAPPGRARCRPRPRRHVPARRDHPHLAGVAPAPRRAPGTTRRSRSRGSRRERAAAGGLGRRGGRHGRLDDHWRSPGSRSRSAASRP